MKVYLGADHAGWHYKEKIKAWLSQEGVEYEDLGNHSLDQVDDYPDFAQLVGEKVALNSRYRGILICGSGTGMCLAANKIRGVRAFIPLNPNHAAASRSHNNTNVICFGQQYHSWRQVVKILRQWLKTPFSVDTRHRRRVSKLER